MTKRTNSKSPAPRGSPSRSTKWINSKKTASTSNHNFNFNYKKLLISASPSLSAMSKNINSISDLKEMAFCRLDDLKRIDHSHSKILKDLRASHSRLHRRLEIQTQTCQQKMDEAEKEFEEMWEEMDESEEAMKATYEEFMADARATASTVSKTSIPEITRSFDKAIGVLQSRYGIPSTDCL